MTNPTRPDGHDSTSPAPTTPDPTTADLRGQDQRGQEQGGPGVIPTRQSLEGVFLTGLRPGTTPTGVPLLRATVRAQNWRYDQGTFIAGEVVTCDLVVYHEATQHARTRFRPGDAFVASGYVHAFTITRDGIKVTCQEFVARRLGHDAARTRYKVTRTRRPLRPTNPRATTTTLPTGATGGSSASAGQGS